MGEIRHFETVLRGVRVCGVEAGDGPTLLLVHGFLVCHREWLPVIPRLAAKFRVIAPDLPGAGGSDRPARAAYPYTREAFAETLVALLDERGVDKAHVAGHSMGGGVALTFAADHPARVDHLIALDSMCFPFDLSLKGRLPLLPVIGGIVFKRLYGRSLFRDYFRNDVWSGHPGVDLAAVDAYYDDFSRDRAAPWATLQATIKDVAPLAAKIPRVEAPTKVIWGAEDRIFPVALAHRLAREIPGATLQILEKSGHAPNEEHPDACARAILDHLPGGA